VRSLLDWTPKQTKPDIVKKFLIVTPKEKPNIFFEIIEHIGQGAFGSVDLIQNIENKNYYIFKIGKDNDAYKEGIQSNMLKGILDDDMLVLYQGKSKTDFLISHYNGKNLNQKYTIHKLKLCEDYKNITIQILDLLYRINSKNIFHNDIKPDNLTIKKGKVYLIDYGLLGNMSIGGSLMSMPFKSVIRDCDGIGFHKYRKYHEYLLGILIDTDIFGFFYCCISLLLFINNKIGIWDIFKDLKIKDIQEDSMYNIFKLYYFILPESKRIIPELNEHSNAIYGSLFSSNDYLDLFGVVPPENINLFRFMSYIYFKLDYYLLSSKDERDYYFLRNKNNKQNLIEFLRVLSDCLLPNFEYATFINKYKIAVSLLFKNYLFVNLYILNSYYFTDNLI